jgi:hypothetical protein
MTPMQSQIVKKMKRQLKNKSKAHGRADHLQGDRIISFHDPPLSMFIMGHLLTPGISPVYGVGHLPGVSPTTTATTSIHENGFLEKCIVRSARLTEQETRTVLNSYLGW